MFKCIRCETCEHGNTRGCKYDTGCDFGRFLTYVVTNFGDYGDWHVRRVGGASSSVFVATITGYGGRVELWGGNHSTEVYGIPKGTKEADIPRVPQLHSKDEIVEALNRACESVGLQCRIRDW